MEGPSSLHLLSFSLLRSDRYLMKTRWGRKNSLRLTVWEQHPSRWESHSDRSVGSWSHAPTVRHQRKVVVRLASFFSLLIQPGTPCSTYRPHVPPSVKTLWNNLHAHPAVPLPGDSKASQGDNEDSVTVFSRSDVSVSPIELLPSSCFLDLLEVSGFFFLFLFNFF